jgi:hypothetical protein
MADKLSAMFAKKDKKKEKSANVLGGTGGVETLTGESGAFVSGSIRIVTDIDAAATGPIVTTVNSDAVDIGRSELGGHEWKAPPPPVAPVAPVAKEPTKEPPTTGKFQARTGPKKGGKQQDAVLGIDQMEWAALGDEPVVPTTPVTAPPPPKAPSADDLAAKPTGPQKFQARGKDGEGTGRPLKASTAEDLKTATPTKQLAPPPSTEGETKPAGPAKFVARGKDTPSTEQPPVPAPPAEAEKPAGPAKFVARTKDTAPPPPSAAEPSPPPLPPKEEVSEQVPAVTEEKPSGPAKFTARGAADGAKPSSYVPPSKRK